jgi:excinuclease ABC subunit A
MQETKKTSTANVPEGEAIYDERTHIIIKGARSNNLKNIDVVLPKFQLIVITGVSGSGKSSLTMETLYAEGQRRYVESLSSYARQFLTRIKKPDVDYIMGICPAIAVEQRVTGSNARSTVGSMTELNDYLRLLYARIGKMISPISGREVKRHSVSDVVDFIESRAEGSKIQLFIPLSERDCQRPLNKVLALLLQRGFSRVKVEEEMSAIQDLLEQEEIIDGASLKELGWNLLLLVDRVVIAHEDVENSKRIADSVQTALAEGEGVCIVDVLFDRSYAFSTRFELDGIEFPELRPQLFNYNNPYGACTVCEGYGMTMGIDESRVVPDDSLTLYEGAIACWSGERGNEWLQELMRNAHKFDFPLHTPYRDLTPQEKNLLWSGNTYFEGLNAFFEMLESQTYKIQNRVLLSRFRGKTRCGTCKGYRLRKEALYVFVGGKHIGELMEMPIDELISYFENLELEVFERKVASRLLTEIENRLEIMDQIGLGYLHLDRLASTLSGGETQRINLTRTLGSNLTNSLYILDEPSIGLHPKDTDRLIAVLKELRDLGNTVVVVEHEEEVIEQADCLIDIGPGAGIHGGRIVYSGPIKSASPGQSLTIDYINGHERIEIPKFRRAWDQSIVFKGVRMHNLKNIEVEFPLGVLTVVTGVSGSGKSSLVKGVFYEALAQEKGLQTRSKPGVYKEMSGHIEAINSVEWVNQQPIGRSSRSNPVTYVKAYDYVRALFSEQHMSKIRGFTPRHFSFNVEGGRCEECKGEGHITVEMQFLADVTLECEACKGRRFKREVLDVTYKGKSIYDVLCLSIEEAIGFFEGNRDIIERIQPLFDVGLGYIQLGQSSSTLSGGEAQRVKLAYYLGKEGTTKNMLFIFDEPTTGLHFEDIKKLLYAFNALIDKGHTVLVVEHNLEVVKCADWVIDLGPGGGKQGGQLIFAGIPERLAEAEGSYTGEFLRKKLRIE